MSDFTNFRAVYDELTDEVSRAQHQFVADHLRNWFETIDQTPRPAAIVARLEKLVNFKEWYEVMQVNYRKNGGNFTLDFGHTKDKKLAMRLALFRAISRNELNAAEVGFWAKAPAGIHAWLRVLDSTKQVLQYDLARPFGADDPTAWFRQVVELDAPDTHFGGTNDGVLHGAITQVTILAANPLEKGAVGAIDFDEVVAIDAVGATIDLSKTPMIGGPEVLTSDNAVFDKTGKDLDRMGLIQLVPFYGHDGKLRGGVAAVLRSGALRNLIPPKDYALVNTAYDFVTLASSVRIPMTTMAIQVARGSLRIVYPVLQMYSQPSKAA